MRLAINSLFRSCLVGLALTSPALAQSLAVSPTKVDVAPAGQHTTMTVKASGQGQSVVQLRIFSWNEGQSPAQLRDTRDVQISPPMARLTGRQELTVRIVRTANRRVQGRECYRVLVDRLPTQSRSRSSQIGLRIRHSVPVCFTG